MCVVYVACVRPRCECILGRVGAAVTQPKHRRASAMATRPRRTPLRVWIQQVVVAVAVFILLREAWRWHRGLFVAMDLLDDSEPASQALRQENQELRARVAALEARRA